jgi:hypothetical protein
MPLCLTRAIDIPDKERFTRAASLSIGIFQGESGCFVREKVCGNEKKRLTGERALGNMPFCLRRE